MGFIPTVPVLDYSNIDKLTIDEAKKDEQVLEEMSARFIETMLTKPMFESDLSFFEDEDEESFVSTKQEQEFFNQMLSRELAKELARQDILGLKRMYLGEGY